MVDEELKYFGGETGLNADLEVIDEYVPKKG